MFRNIFTPKAFSKFVSPGGRISLFRCGLIGAGAGFTASLLFPQTFNPQKLLRPFQMSPVIRNDSPATIPISDMVSFNPNGGATARTVGYSQVPTTATQQPPQQQSKTGLGRYINYQQLTLGSMTGAFSGFIIGKFSKLLVVLCVSGYLTTQFLYSRGIQIPGLQFLSTTIIQWGKESISVRDLVMEQPSFKVSFISAFVVAAIYA